MRSLFPIVLGIFAMLILFINPFRESPIADDWSYALTVKHLLETGDYHLHDWAVANFVFQAYWGALFTKIFGFSFMVLSFSTILQAFLALISFYFLAKEHDLEDSQSSLLSLGLLACPLFLLFSISFMTDVPFLAWAITTLLLYTVAVRKQSHGVMLAASVSCTAAILIRQFGLALLMGIVCVWFFQKERKKNFLFFLTGTFLPVLATILQFLSGVASPSWASRLRMREQMDFFTVEGFFIPLHLLWRVAVSLHYYALFALPFVVLACLVLLSRRNQERTSSYVPGPSFIAFVFLFLLAGILYGHMKLGLSWYMPYLPFYLDTLSKGILQPVLITVATLIGGIVFSWLILRRYVTNSGWSMIPAHQRLLDFVSLSLFLLQLIYVQFADRYLMVFLPYIFIVIGRYLADWMTRHRLITALVCFLFIAPSALWTRGWLAHEEAGWKAGEFLRLQGIDPAKIFGTWEWVCYFTFQDFIEKFGTAPPNVDNLYHGWLDEKRRTAEYLIQDTLPSSTEWRIVTEIPYRNSFFQKKKFFVLARTAHSLESDSQVITIPGLTGHLCKAEERRSLRAQL